MEKVERNKVNASERRKRIDWQPDQSIRHLGVITSLFSCVLQYRLNLRIVKGYVVARIVTCGPAQI